MKGPALGLSLCIALAGAKAFAQDAPTQNANDAWRADARTIAHIQEIVRESKGTDGVFVVRDNGDIAHVQSGLICPPKFPNADFWHAEIFDSPLGQGMDVGCDYGRNGADGHPASKLTIFATKAPEGLTLDQAFARDRGEVLQVAPSAKSEGEALNIKNDSSSSLPEVRSEEFLELVDGRAFTTQLLVAVRSGWVLEIRATFSGEGNRIVIPAGGTAQDAVLSAGDRLMLAAAYVRAGGTLGK